MREKLAHREGKRTRFGASVEQFGQKPGWKGRSEQTMLLRDVRELQSGERVADHLWFTYTKRWQDADVSPGNKVEFDARVKAYECGYQGRRWKARVNNPPRVDFKLAYPTQIEIV